MPRKKTIPIQRDNLSTTVVNPLLKRYLADTKAASRTRRGSGGEKRRRLVGGDPPARRLVLFGKRRLSRPLGIFEQAKRSDDVVSERLDEDFGDLCRSGGDVVEPDSAAGVSAKWSCVVDDVVKRNAKRSHDAMKRNVERRSDVVRQNAKRWNRGFERRKRGDGVVVSTRRPPPRDDVDEVVGQNDDCVDDDWSVDVRRTANDDDDDDVPCTSNGKTRPRFGEFRRRIADKLARERGEQRVRTSKNARADTASDSDDDDDARTEVSRWSTGASTASRSRRRKDADASPSAFASAFPREAPMAAIADQVFDLLPDLTPFGGERRTVSQRITQRLKRQVLRTNPYLEEQMEAVKGRRANASRDAGVSRTDRSDPAAKAFDSTTTSDAETFYCKPSTSESHAVFNLAALGLLPEQKVLTDLGKFCRTSPPSSPQPQMPFSSLAGPDAFCLDPSDAGPAPADEFHFGNFAPLSPDTDNGISADLGGFSINRPERRVTFNLTDFERKPEPELVPDPFIYEPRNESVFDEVPSMDFKFSRRRMF